MFLLMGWLTPAHAEEREVVVNGEVVGKALVGETLTATVRTFPADAILAYQWHRETGPIAGATNPTLLLDASLLYAVGLMVEVTATAPGFRTTTWTSWGKGVFNTTVQMPTITAGTFRFVSTPTVDKQLLLDSAGWVPREGPEFTYQWLLDGQVVPGPNDSAVIPAASWAGRRLSCRVTASRPHVPSVTVNCPTAVVQPGTNNPDVGVASFNGRDAIVGWFIDVTLLRQRPSVQQTFTWVRVDAAGREAVIAGERGTSYRMTAADIGHRVGVRVTVTSPGYLPESTTVLTSGAVTLNVYSTPGSHVINGREWRTTCEKYSTTERCRTDIRATQVTRVGARYVKKTDWYFNNLTYLPSSRSVWGTNPLANTGKWRDAQGRQWRTECDSINTGRNACRTYIWSTKVNGYEIAPGKWKYVTEQEWVFNNQAFFR